MSEPKLGDWVRHKETGDLWKIKDTPEGKLVISRDLPNQDISVPITQIHKYKVEKNAKQMMPGQLARIAFECDAALCRTNMDLPRPKEWLSTLSAEKSKWIEGKVTFKEDIRKELYLEVMKVLLKYNKDE